VIQPVPPVVPLPSPVIPVQTAPSPVEVASGPLPQPAASDALNFRDAVAASTVEVNKVQEVTMQRATPANRVWSHASKSLGESLDGMTAIEDTLQQSVRDYLKPPASKFADRSDLARVHRGPDGSSESSSSGSSPATQRSLEDFENFARETLQESLTMGAFTVTAEILVRTSSDIVSSVKQLSNGGGGS
jgi:hypothetical protein